jgi:ADP-dependent NAD(P)H-hydrate dehydratase / NAD(P)H-hydrate epimerase
MTKPPRVTPPSSPAAHPLVLSAAQMRGADRGAIEGLGVPSLLLMENAGRGVADIVRARLGGARGRVTIVCGAGSNGGDGFVAARHLVVAGLEVRVLLAAPRARVAGDAAVALAALERMDVAVEDLGDTTDGAAWTARLAGAAAVVDAIFGIGLRDAVAGPPAAAIAAMNAASGLKVAVDVPSGLDADTGRVHGVAFAADITATMGVRKLGLALDADAPVGALEVVDLGVPLAPPAGSGPLCRWTTAGPIAAGLPRRGATAHKGSAGHLVVVAGSEGKTGAALLAGRAALRAGAGLVTIFTTAAGQAALDSKVVEIMTARYSDTDDADARATASKIAALATRSEALVIGPGIPTGPNMRDVVRELASRLPVPMVIDADALNLVGHEIVRVLSICPAPRILTPHPGEMARLVAKSIEEVQADRLETARGLAARTGAIIVLKGARTLIAAPDGTVFINPAACGALGTAGSGDVLTGLIGSLLAQGMEPFAAARAGVFIHGRAGETVAARLGSGLIAGDLPDAIADVIQSGL